VYGEDGKLLGFNGETADEMYDDAELRAGQELARPSVLPPAASDDARITARARGLAWILSSETRFKDERIMVMLEDLVGGRRTPVLFKCFADNHTEVHARLLDVCLGSFVLTPREGFRKAMVAAADALLAAMPELARAQRFIDILEMDDAHRGPLFESIEEFNPAMFEDMVEAAVEDMM
jgi:hypothetical protein